MVRGFFTAYERREVTLRKPKFLSQLQNNSRNSAMAVTTNIKVSH